MGASILTAITAACSEDREHGRVGERGESLRVVIYAGFDPVTGKRVYVRKPSRAQSNSPTARLHRLNKLLSKVAKRRSVNSSVTLVYAIDEWMRQTASMTALQRVQAHWPPRQCGRFTRSSAADSL